MCVVSEVDKKTRKEALLRLLIINRTIELPPVHHYREIFIGNVLELECDLTELTSSDIEALKEKSDMEFVSFLNGEIYV